MGVDVSVGDSGPESYVSESYKVEDLKLLDQLYEIKKLECGISNVSWFFKREISSQDVHIGLLVSCAYARGVANLQHRTIAEFAQFIEDVMSDKPEYQKYRFDWNSRDAIETWIEKFHEYCCKLYDGIMKQMYNETDDK